MYEVYFGLTKRPFSSVPQIGEYFSAAAIEGARRNLERCIRRAEGVGLVIGPSGTGKTLLCHLLADTFRESHCVALLASGRLSTRRALFQAILYELGQPYRGMDENELRLSLMDYLADGEESGEGLVLIVDEAHTLPFRLIDEIRMMTNLARGGRSQVRLILAGGPVLEERLASPKLESFAQRIVARYYLEAMTGAETADYIQAQLSKAGARGEPIFTTAAARAVHHATGGVPRLVNQLCDHAMLLACSAGLRQVEPARVEEAWSDLQQLPTPWNADNRSAEPAGVVEFGGLDDAEENRTPPSLRVAPAEKDDFAEPVEHLDRIQGALDDLDADFQPAGSIGPEVELVFDEIRNPFDESFDEEEVVVNRFSAPVAPVEPRSAKAAEGDERVWREGPRPAAAASVASQPWRESPTMERETVPIPSRAATIEVASLPDDEIVVLEDSQPPAGRPAPVVRRQEYSRLFARLRRIS